MVHHSVAEIPLHALIVSKINSGYAVTFFH